MSTSKRMIVALVMAGFVWLTVPMLCRATEEKNSEDTKAIGIDAYIYGYPLVTMEMTRRVMTNVAEPQGKLAPWASSPS